MMRRVLATAIGIWVTLVSAYAAACPVCAQRDEEGVMRYIALGALVILPWFVVGGAALYLWRERTALEGTAGSLTDEPSTEEETKR
jgi:hypothetical protein